MANWEDIDQSLNNIVGAMEDLELQWKSLKLARKDIQTHLNSSSFWASLDEDAAACMRRTKEWVAATEKREDALNESNATQLNTGLERVYISFKVFTTYLKEMDKNLSSALNKMTIKGVVEVEDVLNEAEADFLDALNAVGRT
jgi:hypothetical protein